MAAIGDTAAQHLVDEAAEVGITADELGEWSGWGTKFLASMSGRDLARMQDRIQTRRTAQEELARAEVAHLATDAQVRYVVDLLQRRRRTGDAGGFVGTAGLVDAAGAPDRAAIQQLTRRQASALITS